MKFSEIVDQAVVLVRRRGRVSYRALQEELDLHDKQLDALKEELLFSHTEIAVIDERGMVWNGAPDTQSTAETTLSQSRPPVSYTPSHLAERILAEQAAMESR